MLAGVRLHCWRRLACTRYYMGGVGGATTRWRCVNFYLEKLVLVANFKQIIAMCIEGDGVSTRLQPTARANTCR